MAETRRIEQLPPRMKRVTQLLNIAATEIGREAPVVFGRTAIQATPVVGGKLVTNWRAGVGSPPGGVLETAGSGAAKSVALSRLAGGVGLWEVVEGSSLFIVNNAPYFFKVDRGSTEQAPVGMTNLALAATFFRAARSILARIQEKL